MTTAWRVSLLATLVLLLSPSVTAATVVSSRPDTTTRGVVWTPPPAADSALHDLGRMADLGATAVRVRRLPSDTVAARATALGLDLYVDLPVHTVPAERLDDALEQAVPLLERLHALARRHRSVTHVGLAHSVDTTVPAACETLRRWTERVHTTAPSLRTYYVTPFTAAADRCAQTVDRVLLDLRGHPAPIDRWKQWRATADEVGVGALGTWTDPTAGTGLNVPHSPERQARYLEQHLARLLDSTRAPPSVVFVSRWRDRATPLLPSRRYGLHTAEGTPRPAARVVQGFYTGTQRVFALPAGPPSAEGPYRLVLLGWALVALLGGLYGLSPFVRDTVARYFTAPGFYRDALRDGRDLTLGPNALLLALVAGTVGTTGAAAARLAAAAPSAEHVLAALPPALQYVGAGSLEHPFTASLLIAGAVISVLAAWGVALVLAARWQGRFSVAQGLVTIVWPCWPALLFLPLALAAGPDAPLSPPLFGLLLLGGSGLLLVSVTGRVLYDYWTVADLPGWLLIPLLLLSPLGLTAATVFVLTLRYDLSLAYLWHLTTLTS